MSQERIAKYRDPANPGKWWLTDFTMEQVEGLIASLKDQVAKINHRSKKLVERLDESSEYDAGFNCVHGRAFDCADCLARLSKRQRGDAAEISKLRAELKIAEARGRDTGLEEAALKVEEWATNADDDLCADAIRALKKG